MGSLRGGLTIKDLGSLNLTTGLRTCFFTFLLWGTMLDRVTQSILRLSTMIGRGSGKQPRLQSPAEVAVEVVKDEAATEEAAMVEEVMAVARVTVARVHMVVRARAKVVLSASHAASGQQVTVLMAIAVDFHIIHDLEPQNTIQYNTITSDGRQ